MPPIFLLIPRGNTTVGTMMDVENNADDARQAAP
jgi:hypothetical protein